MKFVRSSLRGHENRKMYSQSNAFSMAEETIGLASRLPRRAIFYCRSASPILLPIDEDVGTWPTDILRWHDCDVIVIKMQPVWVFERAASGRVMASINYAKVIDARYLPHSFARVHSPGGKIIHATRAKALQQLL